MLAGLSRKSMIYKVLDATPAESLAGTVALGIGHVKEWAEKRLPTVTLCSTTGNELLEVWYYGDLLTAKGEPQAYIVDGDVAPGLVAARDPENGEEFVIFDGGRHGYDNMFCDEHDPSE